MRATTKRLIVLIILIAMNVSLFQSVSYAGIIDTNSVLSAENKTATLDKTERFLLKENVSDVLLSLGVTPEKVLNRVQTLNDRELLLLSEKIDQAPAGAGVVEVIGIVFIVLIILELIGVTDIFKRL